MSRPPRIAYISHCARLSGAEIGLLRLVEAAAGQIAATVVLAEDGPLVEPLERAGARVAILPLAEQARSLTRAQVAGGRSAGRTALEVARYVGALAVRLRALQPDLVHTNTLKAGVYGTAAARLAGLPTVWHLHDRIARDYLPGPVAPLMRGLVTTAPSALIVPSQATLETVGRPWRPGLRTAVIPLPIPQPAKAHEIRPVARRIGIVGRLTPWKGQHVFLRAFAAAFGDGDQEAVVIGAAMFGEDLYARELERLAAELGIGDRVTFTGFRRDVAAELAALDVLVHASVLADPLATVVLEGMAAGVPVVSADAGGHAAYVTDGRDGLLHRPGDVDGLAAAMRRAVGDHALRVRLGAEGRRTAARFSGPVVLEEMLALYRDVLGNRR